MVVRNYGFILHKNTIVDYKRFLIPIYLLLLVIIIATAGYMLLENYSFLDALYMTIITIATIGYHEVQPLHDAGKIFNIFIIISSITITTLAITQFTRYVIDGEINLYFKNRKLMNTLNKLENHVILCGYGRNGKQAAETLLQHKVDFVVIDVNDNHIAEDRLSANKILFIKGDATEDETLLKAGIKKAKALISALPDDADNVFIVLSACALNSQLNIISRASHATSVAKLKKAGASHVILPDNIGGTHMATLVTKPDIIEFIDYLSGEEGEGIHLEAVTYDKLPAEIKDTTLKQVMDWRKTGVNCLGVKNAEGKFVINPPENTLITKGMKVIILGTKEQIENMKGNVGTHM